CSALNPVCGGAARPGGDSRGGAAESLPDRIPTSPFCFPREQRGLQAGTARAWVRRGEKPHYSISKRGGNFACPRGRTGASQGGRYRNGWRDSNTRRQRSDEDDSNSVCAGSRPGWKRVRDQSGPTSGKYHRPIVNGCGLGWKTDGTAQRSFTQALPSGGAWEFCQRGERYTVNSNPTKNDGLKT